MPVHDISANLMVELLSLEHSPDGWQMEVGLTRSGGSHKRQMISIDEYTYLQLLALGPFEGQRVRLSLYTKWDPFRGTHFSSLVKMNRTFSETLYFACSEGYKLLLLQLAQQKEDASSGPGNQPVAEEAAAPAAPAQQKLERTALLSRPILLRGLVFSLVLAVFLLRMDGEVELFTNSVEAKQDVSLAAAGAGTQEAVPVPVSNASDIQLAALQSEPAGATPAPAEIPEITEQSKLSYETIELTGDSYEYSLPKGYVALSFDDGPSRYTELLVDILVKAGVAANFLFIGQNVSQYPEAVSYADEHGMPVGNHSWDHSDLTANSAEENRTNLARASQSLEQLIAGPVTIFRPPYGAVNQQLAEEAGRQHLKVLLWNRDPEDWKADSPEKILNYFYHTEPSGGIYLLHEKSITVKVLPEIIAYLKQKGLKFAIFK
ncbi:polysaccharide deacetylase family protein [Paenibacillus tianjinensis]|uniref:Polysaccharide deacetylase family protein n=1 Tax=Paenibacillus tianjinensis TaxID=2810347 RepID=A0ABX7L9W0_9BACL|nr:polysaccharide deacetylase family protein [Paenibacillus tianjinensis]QSF44960.1 polysaccharide deacetylase family protein [Paenibacillus tianjinensis]